MTSGIVSSLDCLCCLPGEPAAEEAVGGWRSSPVVQDSVSVYGWGFSVWREQTQPVLRVEWVAEGWLEEGVEGMKEEVVEGS